MPLTPQRLTRLVRHREQLERLQESEFAAAQRLYLVRLRALADAHEQREQVMAAGIPAAGPIHLADLLAGVEYLRRNEREIAARRAAAAHSEQGVASEREELFIRRRERKAMETLLERRIEEDRIARNRADIKRIDELASVRWRRPEHPASKPGRSLP